MCVDGEQKEDGETKVSKHSLIRNLENEKGAAPMQQIDLPGP